MVGLREGEIIYLIERGFGKRGPMELRVRKAEELESFVTAAFTSRLVRLGLRDRATGEVRKVFVRLQGLKPEMRAAHPGRNE